MSSGDIPLRETEFVIFGGTGDLTRRKLLPALYNLHRKFKVPFRRIILLGRRNHRRIPQNYDEEFRRLLNFLVLDVKREEDFLRLKEALSPDTLKVFYLAIPPFLFREALRGIGEHLRFPDRRVVVEKPFGLNLQEAKELNALIERYFREEEVFRIDHFLGKPQVQNILSFKLSNQIALGLLNRNYVERVEIVALEKEGVEGRRAYYDRVGALRDMVQNHLLMLLALVAMDTPPDSLSLQRERERTLRFVKIFSPEEVFAYFKRAKYREYEGEVETFVEGTFFLENERWVGVPFRVVTGKRMGEKRTEIRVFFRSVAPSVKRILGCVPPVNLLTFGLYPDLTVKMTVNVISPEGFFACSRGVEWKVDMREVLGEVPEAYESLLLDVLKGDRRIFIGKEEVITLWQITEPILEAFQNMEMGVY